MKKEVTVCDAPDCRRLADVICPICERDLCRDHRKAFIELIVTCKRPGTRPSTEPVPPGNPTYYDANNEATCRVEMCNSCWSSCGDAQAVASSASGFKIRSVFVAYTNGQSPGLIEIVRAAIAENKLAEK